MELYIAPSWKALAVRGLASALLGIVALAWPSITLVSLVLLFGAYALLDGLFALNAAFRDRGQGHSSTIAVEGLVGVGVGLAAVFWTGMTALVLADLMALWAILTGALEIAASVRLRHRVRGAALLGLAGAASLVLGVAILESPTVGALAIVILFGSYALFFGAAMLALALRLRRWVTSPRAHHAPLTHRHHAV